MQIVDGEDYAQWTVQQVDDNGVYPTIAVNGGTFSFDGFMTNIFDGSTAPATMSVNCG